jgi:multiple antibiotic resistance protein
MIQEFAALVVATFAALFPIANPFSTAPVFATLTARMPDDRRDGQARLACLYMGAVLLVSLIAGALILTFFGISLPVLRIGGGMIIARVGFDMLSPSPDEDLSDEKTEEALRRSDIAFTPIAMPLLSGPGSIAVTISMATEAESVEHYLAVGVGIVLVSFVSWIVLRSSARVVGFLGANGTHALSRVMGFLLACIGIQFVATGLIEGLSNEDVIGPIVEAFRNAGGGGR